MTYVAYSPGARAAEMIGLAFQRDGEATDARQGSVQGSNLSEPQTI